MSPPTTIRGGLFDLDGTLVDNMPFYIAAWIETARSLGRELTAATVMRDFVFDHLGLRDRFRVVVGAEEVSDGASNGTSLPASVAASFPTSRGMSLAMSLDTSVAASRELCSSSASLAARSARASSAGCVASASEVEDEAVWAHPTISNATPETRATVVG